MNKNKIKLELIRIVSQLFEKCGFDAKMIEYVDLIDDLGMDSLTFISFVVEIETSFNVCIPDNQLTMDNFRTVNNIIETISAIEVK